MRSAKRGATRPGRAGALALALVPVMVLAACTGGGAGNTDSRGKDGKGAPEVVMELVAYKPDRLEVSS
ncbi:MAG: hypothetical protein ACRDJF_04230, partial [Actinomycetota bacterium]